MSTELQPTQPGRQANLPAAQSDAADAAAAHTDAAVVAREVAAVYARSLKFYVSEYKLTPEEARKRADEPPSEELIQGVLTRTPDQVHWHDLHWLGQKDEAAALKLWQNVKDAALKELQSGHRAAMVLDAGHGECWQRAKYLALRRDLADEWQPRNGMERQLIDTLALTQASFLYWLERLQTYSSLESWRDKDAQEVGRWAPKRVSDAEAIQQAAEMMDRFNRMMLRTLRALRDLRRYSTPVIVQNAGQVNIGEKQVNVAAA